MSKKIKEYFQGKNPYLLASAAIVIVSIFIISMILKDEVSTEKESDTDAMSTQQSTEASITETESIQEAAVTEESEVVDEVQESEPIEEPVQKDEEATSVAESESENIAETQSKPEEFVQSTPVPEKETPQENVTKPKETVTPEVNSVPQPEPSAPQESEIAPPEETAVPEDTPAPQPTPTPEEAPMPEATPSPEKAPEVHEHCWIFDSWYQEPTCSNGGLVNEICAHCGETQVTGGTPTGKHSYIVESTGDCCSEEVVVCTECNHRQIGEKNHNNHIDVEDGFCYGCGKKTD